MKNEELARQMVQSLAQALGDRLESVVLYGPEARGDEERARGHLYLMIVLRDLEPETLAMLGDPVRWWLGKRQPWPRLFTRKLIADTLDVFPIELDDISRHHRVLHGTDPVGDIRIEPDKLRLQCERELREKLMRLREGYVECWGSGRVLKRLLVESFMSFEAVWRGCLRLLEAPLPDRDSEVVTALAERLDLPPAPLQEVARLAAGDKAVDVHALFASYYRAVSAVVERVDRLVLDKEGASP